MDHLWRILPFLHLGIAAIFSLIAISRRRDPSATLAWILCFFFLPYLGMLLYLLFGYNRLRRRRRKKPDPARRAGESLKAGGRVLPSPELETDLAGIAALADNLTEMPVMAGNRVLIHEDANRTYGAIAEAIQDAKHHVHLEYYIFQPDATGRYFRDLLADKARQGVECRLLADTVGSWRLSKRFLRPLADAGVRAAFFGPVRLFRRPWGFHLRNHRKVAVIDGRIGFIGSQNIGNEYLRWRARRIPWRDTHLAVEGPAVGQLQTIFAEDWCFTTGEDLAGDDYFPRPAAAGRTHVQAVPTGPDEEENALQLLFLAAVHAARERITITTPYFAPDTAVVLALEGAARRGVRVDLLLPVKSDHPVVLWAGRSWYRDLLESGVRIHEHAETFLHAKVVTVDQRLSLVGSANMDIRSYLINFEAGVLLYDRGAAARLVRTFDETAARAREVRLEDLEGKSFARHVLEGACRVLSPLL